MHDRYDPLRNHNRHDPRAWARGILDGSIGTRKEGTFKGNFEGVYCYGLEVKITPEGMVEMFFSFDDYCDSGGGHDSCTPVRRLAAELTRKLYRQRPAGESIEVTVEGFVRLRGVFEKNYVEKAPTTQEVSIPTKLADDLRRWLLQL